jgi:hypothetical protein
MKLGSTFQEFIPASKQNMLVFLSIFWSFGSVLGSFLAWIILPAHSCEFGTPCDSAQNKGWRNLLYITGKYTSSPFELFVLIVYFRSDCHSFQSK